MDPKLREQLFIRRHSAGILTVIALLILLPILIIFPQAGTQYKQQASEIKKKPILPKISEAAGSISNKTPDADYSIFIKCFDKPNQTNPCSPLERKAADLNYDGIVDGIDYNILIRKRANPEISK